MHCPQYNIDYLEAQSQETTQSRNTGRKTPISFNLENNKKKRRATTQDYIVTDLIDFFDGD